MTRPWIFLLLPAVSACGGTSTVDACSSVAGTCLSVQVEGSSSLRFDTLSFHVVGGGFDVTKQTSPAKGGVVEPPVAAALIFDSPAASGNFSVEAVAELGGSPIASGFAPAVIVADHHQTVVLSLTAASGWPDLAMSVAEDMSKETDGGGGEPDLGGGDMPASVFVPTHVLASTIVAGAPDLVLSANPSTIDTTALTINGATSPYFVKQTSGGTTYAVLFTRAFSVQNQLVITGGAPLIVAARDVVTVTASINLNGSSVNSGPGALSTGVGIGSVGATFVNQERESSGGGGGSYGSLGGPGGTGDPTVIPAGASGVRYGNVFSDPLVGGSVGGAGGDTTTGGGGGGGALQISSPVSISIASTATINAGGGGGSGGGAGLSGGGGGGSGGELFFEAPTITNAGTLVANGGGGGGGGSGGSGGTPTTSGSDGNPGPGAAMGGTGGVPMGSNGGNGAAGPAGAFVDATPGSGVNSKGGGGGGGAGKIWLRYRSSSTPSLNSTRISPPAGIDTTFP